MITRPFSAETKPDQPEKSEARGAGISVDPTPTGC